MYRRTEGRNECEGGRNTQTEPPPLKRPLVAVFFGHENQTLSPSTLSSGAHKWQFAGSAVPDWGWGGYGSHWNARWTARMETTRVWSESRLKQRGKKQLPVFIRGFFSISYIIWIISYHSFPPLWKQPRGCVCPSTFSSAVLSTSHTHTKKDKGSVPRFSSHPSLTILRSESDHRGRWPPLHSVAPGPSRGQRRNRNLWSSPAPSEKWRGARGAAWARGPRRWTPCRSCWRLPSPQWSGRREAGLSSGEARPSPFPEGVVFKSVSEAAKFVLLSRAASRLKTNLSEVLISV